MRNNKGFKNGCQLLLTYLFGMFGSSLFAQELTVKGRVVNNQNNRWSTCQLIFCIMIQL